MISMDVVYVVGSDSDELRYSLRSLANLPHRMVYIAGFIPDWVQKVQEVPVPQTAGPQQNSNTNLLRACLAPNLTDNFIFMNDDFFIMKPVERVENYHQGPLRQRIEQYVKNKNMTQAYSLIKTEEELERLGIKDPMSFELHTPMVMNKHKLLEAFNIAQCEMLALRPRTFYANYANITAKENHDVKGIAGEEEIYLSTSDDFDTHPAGELIRNRFPAPSPYEIPTSI